MTKEEFASRVSGCDRKLYLYALSIVRNAEDAKDAAAAAVAYAWEKLSRLRDETKFDVWLLKITYREAIKIKRHNRPYEDVSEFSEAFSYELNTEDLEFLDILSRAGLDEKTNSILTLRFMYMYTLEEISAQTGMPLSSVKTKYYRALDKLSKKLGL
jgi:RNA polymerase sigma-70 factor (ECF subfamily)